MGKEFCEDCPHRENCFVREKQQFYSYGFYERKLALAHRRKRLDNPAEKEFLNLRAGAESLVNEVYYQDGEKARFTGTIKVKNASIAKAIGTNSSEPHDSWNRRRSGALSGIAGGEGNFLGSEVGFIELVSDSANQSS